jgi:LacI family transcriptional regulator
MTVSAVLNAARSGTRVSEATRQRIIEAARRLKYRPNAIAQGLSKRRMNTIGVVCITQFPTDINMIVHEVLNGILDGANTWNQYTIVCTIADWVQEQKMLGMCDGRLDGLILLGPSLSESFAEQLYSLTEYVSIHSDGPVKFGVNMDADNYGGAQMATKHLISLGHRRIAHFEGDARYHGTADRTCGYRTALEEAGIEFDPSLVFPGSFTSPSGFEQAQLLMDKSKTGSMPTAIFCASDAIAIGALQKLIESGFRVPEDISITGFDDSLISMMASRQITTVRQPLHKMGRFAVEQLLEQIDLDQPDHSATVIGRDRGRTTELLLKSGDVVTVTPQNDLLFRSELVLRESTAPPKS